MLSHHFGHNLIEIILALAILLILTSISIPLYTHHLTQARRLEAASALTKLAIAMEDYHIENNTYQNASLSILQVPEIIAENNYKLSIQTATVIDFVLIAQPLQVQASRDTACGALILHANGKKAISGSGELSSCW